MEFVIGFVLGIALLALVLWLRSKKIAVRWYEWLLGALGALFLFWAVHDYFASVAELCVWWRTPSARAGSTR